MISSSAPQDPSNKLLLELLNQVTSLTQEIHALRQIFYQRPIVPGPVGPMEPDINTDYETFAKSNRGLHLAYITYAAKYKTENPENTARYLHLESKLDLIMAHEYDPKLEKMDYNATKKKLELSDPSNILNLNHCPDYTDMALEFMGMCYTGLALYQAYGYDSDQGLNLFNAKREDFETRLNPEASACGGSALANSLQSRARALNKILGDGSVKSIKQKIWNSDCWAFTQTPESFLIRDIIVTYLNNAGLPIPDSLSLPPELVVE